MMKKKLILLFLSLCSIASWSQNNFATINIEGKPADIKKSFEFFISKRANDIHIVYKSIDSIGKVNYAEADVITIKRLLQKNNQFFDSLSNDSLVFFQKKLDSIQLKSTYYKVDSTTIYKNTHPSYWKLLEIILKTPNDLLTKQQFPMKNENGTYCFFTLKQNETARKVHIEDVDPKIYPLLSKLVSDSFEIMRTHQIVMKRRNN